MGNRRGVGGAGYVLRLRGAWNVALVLCLCLIGTAGDGARARGAARPLDYHAMLLNGRIVGSAFAVAEGVGVTNAHVLRGRRPGEAVILRASGEPRGKVTVRIRAISARMDLALLDLPADLLPVVRMAPRGVVPGQRAVAAGVDAGGPAWPGPVREASGEVTQPQVGLAAFGLGLILRMPGARPGFSGGPLFDAQGQLLGMVSAIRTGAAARPAGGFGAGGAGATEAFALGVDEIRAEVARLLAGG